MNKYFNIKRFGKFLMYDLKNAIYSYGLLYICLIFLPVIIMLLRFFVFHLSSGVSIASCYPNRIAVLLLAIVIYSLTYGSMVYGKLTDKKQGSQWMLIPVSILEKYISMIVISLIILPLFFILGYFLVDYFMCTLLGVNCDSIITDHLIYSVHGTNMTLSSLFVKFSFYMNFTINILVFILGAIFFRTKKIIKTGICYFIITSILGTILIKLIFGLENNFNFNYQFYESHIKLMINLLTYIPLVILLIANYFRFKSLKY